MIKFSDDQRKGNFNPHNILCKEENKQEDFKEVEKNNKIDLNENIDYLLYVKKDLSNSQKIWKIFFEKFMSALPSNKKMGNKHKCDRNQYCECIELGKYLLEIEMNLNLSSSNKNLFTLIEKYYYNPGINLPFELFKSLSKAMIKLLDFQNVRSLIENYITYSKIKGTKTTTTGYEIPVEQFEELNEILIFEVILVQGGFQRAKAKITSGIKEENIKQKFLEKYYKILFSYTKERERDLMTKFIHDSEKLDDDENYSTRIIKNDENLYKKLSSVIDNTSGRNFKFDNLFSRFIIKNSLLQKIFTLILNKKFLIFAFSLLIMVYIRKIIKNKKLDVEIYKLLQELAVFLKKYKLFSAINSFSRGIFKLLINY
jgi:hypothetical protein